MTPRALDVGLIWFFFLLNGGYLLLSLIAFRDVYAHLKRSLYGGHSHFARSPLTPPVSIIVPAHNEEVGIALTTGNLLHLDYMRYEVVVVNDGSKDGTLAALKEAFDLELRPEPPDPGLPTKPVRAVYRSRRHHNLVVVDKENGGKADALNAGLNAAVHPYFCCVDADVILEADALQRVVRPILESEVRVIAVGGIIRVANGCRVEKGRVTEVELSANPLVMFQIIEYFRAFLCGRTGFSRLNALMIISGAFGVFERDLVVEAGGYRVGTVGEDMDLVTRLHARMRRAGEKDYKVAFVPDPVCWTEAPSTASVLSRQRRRWHRGLLETMSANRGMLFNPRFGWIGLFSVPFHLLLEGWGVLLELLGYCVFAWSWSRGAVDADFMIAFICVSFFAGATLSLFGVLLGEMTPRPYPKVRHWIALCAYALLENFGYRQWTSMLRLWGLVDHLRGASGWGVMTRTGLGRRP
ncbi:MAG: glycosyltransferase family 2 protein [Elusimicrobiota bacterium]|nr:MAG: glycosyltransferase family 2 protein [Elusimicrobiota bacterium]